VHLAGSPIEGSRSRPDGEDQVQILVVASPLRGRVQHDGQPAGQRVGLDGHLLAQFSYQPTDRVFASVKVSSGQAQLPVAVAGPGPAQQQNTIVLDAHPADGGGEVEPVSRHHRTVRRRRDSYRQPTAPTGIGRRMHQGVEKIEHHRPHPSTRHNRNASHPARHTTTPPSMIKHPHVPWFG
jgi:hypothetical protein